MVISLFTYFDLQQGRTNIYALWLIIEEHLFFLNHGHSHIAKEVYLAMHTFDLPHLHFHAPRTNRLIRKTFLNNPGHSVI